MSLSEKQKILQNERSTREMPKQRDVERPKKMDAFCKLVGKGVTPSTACEQIDVARTTIYEWRLTYPEFAEAWTAAVEIGNEFLEDVIRKHSAKDWRAAEALLKARNRKKWGTHVETEQKLTIRPLDDVMDELDANGRTIPGTTPIDLGEDAH